MQKVKNGFTLIELLGVILLLAIIAVTIIALSDRMLKTSKESLYETQKETIIHAASKWTISHSDILPNSSADESYKLQISTLVNDGYLDSDDLIDPRDNSKMDVCVIVSYNDAKNQYKYEFSEKDC